VNLARSCLANEGGVGVTGRMDAQGEADSGEDERGEDVH
jgi:hypothetical protein